MIQDITDTIRRDRRSAIALAWTLHEMKVISDEAFDLLIVEIYERYNYDNDTVRDSEGGSSIPTAFSRIGSAVRSVLARKER